MSIARTHFNLADCILEINHSCPLISLPLLFWFHEIKLIGLKICSWFPNVAEIRKLLQEHEVEKMLILFLSHPDAKVQIAASQAIRMMSENLLSRDCTGRYGKCLHCNVG